MPKLNQIVTRSIQRWRTDLQTLLLDIPQDPLGERSPNRWEPQMRGEIRPGDVHYGIFLGIITLVPAFFVATASQEAPEAVLAHFLRVPLMFAITLFLTTVLSLGITYLNRKPREFSEAFKLALRILAAQPILGFLLFFKIGEPIALLLHGFLVARSVRKAFGIPVRNAVVFFGSVYFTFAILQLHVILNPPKAREPFQYPSSALPPSKGTILTSSSSATPS